MRRASGSPSTSSSPVSATPSQTSTGGGCNHWEPVSQWGGGGSATRLARPRAGCRGPEGAAGGARHD
ncbi:hypothetical protein ON010_g11463 [Phytophthora cinnamomi]|nr:hypothetical protein ON010_g11463 [Phytophthora cinnamomi]